MCVIFAFLNAGVVTRTDGIIDLSQENSQAPTSEHCPKVFGGTPEFYSTGVVSEIISLKKKEKEDKSGASSYKYVMTLKGVQVCFVSLRFVQDVHF